MSTAFPKGIGSTRFSKDHTGVLISLEPREGTYEITTAEGEQITLPNSWIARFADGTLFNWAVYVDRDTGELRPWDYFDPEIDLEHCATHDIPVHLWRDENGRQHLTLV